MNSSNNKTFIKKSIYIILVFILFSSLAFILFYNLGNSKIEDWDEARHGVNAYEMIQNNDYVVTTYGYKTDYFNLKPPLSEYFIIMGYKLFGYNALGLRFYSALSMLICAAVCFIYSYKKIGKVASLWTLLCFSMFTDIIYYHCARNGDADSLFVLFSTIATLGLLLNSSNMKGFYISCLCFSLAFLIKSYHAATIAVIICFYFILNYKNLKINRKKVLMSFACALVPILIWGIARFSFDGFDFIKQMLYEDVFHRSAVALDGCNRDFLFYVKNVSEFNSIHIYNILIALALWFNRKKREIWILILSVIIPIILFSFVSTKMFWYILCIYPSIALLGSYGFQELYKIKNPIKYLCIVLILLSSFVFVSLNYRLIIEQQNDENIIFSFLDREYKGKEVYLYDAENESQNWSQSKFLSVELYGDLKPLDGGYNIWIDNEESYLLISKNNLEKINDKYNVVSSGEEYVLIKH